MGWLSVLAALAVVCGVVALVITVWKKFLHRRRRQKGRIVEVALAKASDLKRGTMLEVSTAGLYGDGVGVPDGSVLGTAPTAANARGKRNGGAAKKAAKAADSIGKAKKVLLVRGEDGELHCLGAKCAHNGGPLAKGVLCGDRLTCPWHAGCFNVKTGNVEDGPTLDALPCYEVREGEDGIVYARLPGTSGEIRRRRPISSRLCRAVDGDERVFVIVGGGPAGLSAVQTLREEGYTGHIRLISKEDHLPYDRSILNRHIGTAEEVDDIVRKTTLRPEKFYEEYDVLAYLGAGSEVVSLDTGSQTINTYNGGSIHYDKLLCATGGSAVTFRPPPADQSPAEADAAATGAEPVIPGADLGNIFTLRTADDASRLGKALKAVAQRVRKERGHSPSVLIVGASFIGMEAAAFISMCGVKSVTVVGREREPFARKLGTTVGQYLRRMATDHGIGFDMGCVVTEFRGTAAPPSSDDQPMFGTRNVCQAVVQSIDDGRQHVVPCDVVVVGCGITLNTHYLRDAEGIQLDASGAVLADECLKATDHVYVAGDIASVPYWRGMPGTRIRVEHWNMAVQQGRIAARNMLNPNQPTPLRAVPFFWTSQFRSLRCAGHCDLDAVEETIVHGKPDKFVAYLVANDRVYAVATLNSDPAAVAALELLRLGRFPRPDQLRDAGSFDLPKYVAGVAHKLGKRA